MPEEKRHTVIVGNIGMVYDGTDANEAIENYLEYASQSRRNYGRAAGEPVAHLIDGEPEREFDGEAERIHSKESQAFQSLFNGSWQPITEAQMDGGWYVLAEFPGGIKAKPTGNPTSLAYCCWDGHWVARYANDGINGDLRGYGIIGFTPTHYLKAHE